MCFLLEKIVFGLAAAVNRSCAMSLMQLLISSVRMSSDSFVYVRERRSVSDELLVYKSPSRVAVEKWTLLTLLKRIPVVFD